MNAVMRVAGQIRDLILAGELIPGEPIREVAIATRFATSRTTVREATMRLEFEGIIDREPNRGAIVKAPSSDNLVRLHECRRGLESGAVSIPVSQEQLEVIGQALKELEKVAAQNDRVITMEYDYRFHAALVANYKSQRLSELFEQLYNEQHLYLRTLADSEREFEQDESYLDEHRRIYYSLVAGDQASACRYVNEHIDETYARFAVLTQEDLQSAFTR